MAVVRGGGLSAHDPWREFMSRPLPRTEEETATFLRTLDDLDAVFDPNDDPYDIVRFVDGEPTFDQEQAAYLSAAIDSIRSAGIDPWEVAEEIKWPKIIQPPDDIAEGARRLLSE